MAIPFLSDIDHNQNESKNFVVDKLSTEPLAANSVSGQIYYNTTDSKLYYFDGVVWKEVGSGGGGVGAGVEIINGATTSTPGTWTGTTLDETLFTGKQILFVVPETFDGSPTLNITTSSSPATTNSSRIFSHDIELADKLFNAKSTILLTYLTISGATGWIADFDVNTYVQSKDETVENIITITSSDYQDLVDNNQLDEKVIYNIIDDLSNNIVNNSLLLGILNMPNPLAGWALNTSESPTSTQLANFMLEYGTNLQAYVNNGILLRALKTTGSTKVNYIYSVNYTVSGNTYSYDFDCLTDSDMSFFIYYNGTKYIWNSESACLIGTTLVNTNKGLKFIKDIEIGDKVLSYNFKTQKEEYKEVNNIIAHNVGVLYRIQLDDDIIQSTYDEPFYMNTNNIVQGQFIDQNDILFSTSEEEQKVQKVNVKRNIKEMVYDLSVVDNYNFFITKNKILVATEEATKKE